MENTEDKVTLLQEIDAPAFFVQDGIITAVNYSAQQRFVQPGTPIAPMLVTGQEEYSAFSGLCLYLTVKINEIHCAMRVTRVGGTHLFVMEQDEDQAELQSMALAAQALRAPLSNVMTVADRLFPLSCFDDDPQAQDQIARINKGLYQMLRIICNMSDAYSYSQGVLARTEIREIGSLVEEAFARSAELIACTGIKLRYSGLQRAVYTLVDAQGLERAISNILSNAVKFSPRDGTIDASLTLRGRMLYLTVQNAGSGIPEPLKASIFSYYKRQPGFADTRFGIGLGMVLIRQTAAAHGGTVLLEQGQDFGLRLTMTLPVRQSSDTVRSPMIHIDYAGGRDHRLIELSDCLPPELYKRENIN